MKIAGVFVFLLSEWTKQLCDPDQLIRQIRHSQKYPQVISIFVALGIFDF